MRAAPISRQTPRKRVLVFTQKSHILAVVRLSTIIQERYRYRNKKKYIYPIYSCVGNLLNNSNLRYLTGTSLNLDAIANPRPNFVDIIPQKRLST